MDPLAEKYVSLSPYNYVAGNPLIFIDTDGREIKVAREYKETRTTANASEFSNGNPIEVHDLGVTYVDFSPLKTYAKMNSETGEMDVFITISVNVHPNAFNSEFAKDNPGIGEEVKDHEDAHADQFEESFNKEVSYGELTGKIDEILMELVKNGASNEELNKAFYAMLNEQQQLHKQYDDVEEDANKRAVKKTKARNPSQKFFYNNGTRKLNTKELERNKAQMGPKKMERDNLKPKGGS